MAIVAPIETAFSPWGSAVRNAIQDRAAIPKTEPIAMRVGACVFSITCSVNNAPFATANNEMEIMNRVPIQVCGLSLMKPHISDQRHINSELQYESQAFALIHCDRNYIQCE